MAIIYDLDNEEYEEFIADLPEELKPIARRLPPNRLYRLKSSGHRVLIYSYSESAPSDEKCECNLPTCTHIYGKPTVTVTISGEFNLVRFPRNVFGIDPDDLEECDLPKPGEKLGVLLTEEETEAYINKTRRRIIAERN